MKKLTKDELIKKGFMPEKVDGIVLSNNYFYYEINKNFTVKLYDGTLICDAVGFYAVKQIFNICKKYGNNYKKKQKDIEKDIENQGESFEKLFHRNYKIGRKMEDVLFKQLILKKFINKENKNEKNN